MASDATQTQLTTAEISQACRSLGVGEVIRLEPLSLGWNASVYLLQTDRKASYVLRVTPHQAMTEAKGVLRAASWLAVRGIPVVLPLPLGSERVFSVAGYPAALYPYRPSDPFDPGCTSQLQSAVALLSRLHRLASTCPGPEFTIVPNHVDYLKHAADLLTTNPLWSCCLTELLPDYAESLRQLPDMCHEYASRLTRILPNLPHAVIHGEYHPHNLIWNGSDIVGLIDLDGVRWDARLVDLCVAAYCFTHDFASISNGPAMRPEPFLRFLALYAEYAELEEAELRALPDVLAGTALRDAVKAVLRIRRYPPDKNSLLVLRNRMALYRMAIESTRLLRQHLLQSVHTTGGSVSPKISPAGRPPASTSETH